MTTGGTDPTSFSFTARPLLDCRVGTPCHCSFLSLPHLSFRVPAPARNRYILRLGMSILPVLSFCAPHVFLSFPLYFSTLWCFVRPPTPYHSLFLSSTSTTRTPQACRTLYPFRSRFLCSDRVSGRPRKPSPPAFCVPGQSSLVNLFNTSTSVLSPPLYLFVFGLSFRISHLLSYRTLITTT